MEYLEGRIFTNVRSLFPLLFGRTLLYVICRPTCLRYLLLSGGTSEYKNCPHGTLRLFNYRDLSLPFLALCLNSWLAAVQALCTLSVLSPADLGLLDFGPNTPYFPRQIKSLTRVSEAQAAVIDIETGKPVGPIPEFEKMVTWFRKNLPDESKIGLRIVHGDYKLDNMVFHPIEARVIGILDWELCTLGSPVSVSSPFNL